MTNRGIAAGDPVRIAFIIDQIPWAMAGTERQLCELIGRLDRRRFLPYLVVLRPSPLPGREWTACPVLQLDVPRLGSPGGIRAALSLRAWLKSNRIRIVQTFFKDATALGLLAAGLARVPLRLSSRRNLQYDATPFDRMVTRWLDPLVHYYLVNGEGVRRHLVRTEGIHDARVVIFRNLLDSAFVGMKMEPRRSRDKVVFLMVANLRPVKGHAFLIETVERIRGEIPSALFVLVGSGPQGEPPPETEVFSAVRRAGLQESFRFTGLCTDVKAFLQDADVGLLCSSSEGFSSALLEYLAAGLPCVATDVGSNGELVVQGHNGILVPFGDRERLGQALIRLYNDAELRRKMGESSRRLFEERFAPEPQLEALEGFYLAALNGR